MIGLHEGDCLDIVSGFKAESISAIVTDPPYGLKFMGREWDHGIPGPEFWKVFLRVAKPGAMLMAFGGTRTFHRLTCAIEDAGWEIRDCLGWFYGSWFPKSHDISKGIDRAMGAEREIVGKSKDSANRSGTTFRGAEYKGGWTTNSEGIREITEAATEAAQRWSGYGTALKPAWEPIILAMKPMAGTFAANALEHGVAGLNIDAGRIEAGSSYHDNCVTQGANGDRSSFRIGKKSSTFKPGSGRWPANVVLDEEAAAMLDRQSGDRGGGFGVRGKSKPGIYGGGNGYKLKKIGQTVGFGDNGGASRFFYTAKAAAWERGEGNRHPTVKPLALMEWLVGLLSMPGGSVILDPFMGSGTTGIACANKSQEFVGIEKDAEAFATAKERIEGKFFVYD